MPAFSRRRFIAVDDKATSVKVGRTLSQSVMRGEQLNKC